MRALVGRVTIVSAIMLSPFQTGQATGATRSSTKRDIALQLLCQLIKPPKKCLDVCMLYESGSVLFQPCSDLSDPCIGNRNKVLVESSNEVLL